MSETNETQKKHTHMCETSEKHMRVKLVENTKKNTQTHIHMLNKGKTQTRAKLARNTYMSEKHANLQNERKPKKIHT